MDHRNDWGGEESGATPGGRPILGRAASSFYEEKRPMNSVRSEFGGHAQRKPTFAWEGKMCLMRMGEEVRRDDSQFTQGEGDKLCLMMQEDYDPGPGSIRGRKGEVWGGVKSRSPGAPATQVGEGDMTICTSPAHPGLDLNGSRGCKGPPDGRQEKQRFGEDAKRSKTISRT